MYRVNEFLTPSERMDAMRFGAVSALASAGVPPSGFDKAAEASGGALDLLGTVLRTCAFVGAPVGLVWYAVSRGIRNDSAKTRRMKAMLDHYNSAVAEHKAALSGIRAPGSPAQGGWEA